jgi:hypothetical protein
MRREADDLKLESFGIEVRRPSSSTFQTADFHHVLASSYYRKHVHYEGDIIHEKPKILGNVSCYHPPFLTIFYET